MYWKAVSSTDLQGPQHAQTVMGLYEQAAQLNPYMAEPHLMLAQLHVQAGRWEAAESEARQALQLFLDWGTPYDKVGSAG
jgi:Flp pilus assembly protein TadD